MNFVTLKNGDSWAVSTYGSSDNELRSVLVLLHGYPLDQRLWREQVNELAGTSMVVSLDFPGFGASPASSHQCRMSDLADGVAEVLQFIGIKQPVTVCGLSMGGYVALEFWQRHRQRISGLILADSRVVNDSDEARRNRLSVAESVHQAGVEPIIASMLPKLLSQTTQRSAPDVVQKVTEMMRTATPTGIAAVQRGMAQRADFSQRLRDIDLPVLCIVGADDPISSPAEMQAIARELAQGQFVAIAGAAHLPPIEQPVAFNRAIVLWRNGLMS